MRVIKKIFFASTLLLVSLSASSIQGKKSVDEQWTSLIHKEMDACLKHNNADTCELLAGQYVEADSLKEGKEFMHRALKLYNKNCREAQDAASCYRLSSIYLYGNAYIKPSEKLSRQYLGLAKKRHYINKVVAKKSPSQQELCDSGDIRACAEVFKNKHAISTK